MKKILLKPINRKVPKNKIGQKKHILILIQIQNKIKITTTQIERKNILTKNDDENIGTQRQHEF